MNDSTQSVQTTNAFLHGLICGTIQDFLWKANREQNWRTDVRIRFPVRQETSRKDKEQYLKNFSLVLQRLASSHQTNFLFLLGTKMNVGSWPRCQWDGAAAVLDKEMWVEVITPTSRPGTYELFLHHRSSSLLSSVCWNQHPGWRRQSGWIIAELPTIHLSPQLMIRNTRRGFMWRKN